VEVCDPVGDTGIPPGTDIGTETPGTVIGTEAPGTDTPGTDPAMFDTEDTPAAPEVLSTLCLRLRFPGEFTSEFDLTYPVDIVLKFVSIVSDKSGMKSKTEP
jgi:hypothetical protein